MVNKHRIVLEGSPEAFAYLEKLCNSGELNNLLGVSNCQVFREKQSVIINSLSDWFSGIFTGFYQQLNTLFNPQQDVAFSFRGNSNNSAIVGGRIIDLGLQLQEKKVALVVNITPVESNKRQVLVQLFPTGKDRCLPPNIKLVILDKSGKIFKEVESRSQDNYIQLPAFTNSVGTTFTVQVILGEAKITEDLFVI